MTGSEKKKEMIPENSNNHLDMKGFEIERRTNQMFPVTPNNSSNDWELAEFAAQLAALTHEGTVLEYRQLIKVTIQLVAGLIYYVTFTAVDPNDQVEKIYRAKVWATVPSGLLNCLYCQEFQGSQESAEESREKITAILEKLPKKRRPSKKSSSLEDSNGSDDQVQRGFHPGTVIFAPERKELLINAFCFLMKELRAQNPSWKHARVRKAASKRWRSLVFRKRLPYMQKAREQWLEKVRRQRLQV